ncbi:hypothetical protein [Flexivirga alba]|uniref:NADH-ubiquinone oxidoreductase 51kDa subunit FMN-binding domain-containing protein n=1 Tax=Flexivirga alba TaxID=702742 RepID=A0ABW2AGD8_9MICO
MTPTKELADLLAEAGLTGRGGAGFSTAQKVSAAQDRGASLIVNACDGELDAAKDWFVVSQHLDELVHGAHLIVSDVRYATRRGVRPRICFAQRGFRCSRCRTDTSPPRSRRSCRLRTAGWRDR